MQPGVPNWGFQPSFNRAPHQPGNSERVSRELSTLEEVHLPMPCRVMLSQQELRSRAVCGGGRLGRCGFCRIERRCTSGRARRLRSSRTMAAKKAGGLLLLAHLLLSISEYKCALEHVRTCYFRVELILWESMSAVYSTKKKNMH